MEIYFTLSPKLALLLTNKECYKDTEQIEATDNDVSQYNKSMYKEADR